MHLRGVGGEVLEDGGGGRGLWCIGVGVDEVNARDFPVDSLQPSGHPGAQLHIMHLRVLVRERSADCGRLHRTAVGLADRWLKKCGEQHAPWSGQGAT